MFHRIHFSQHKLWAVPRAAGEKWLKRMTFQNETSSNPSFYRLSFTTTGKNSTLPQTHKHRWKMKLMKIQNGKASNPCFYTLSVSRQLAKTLYCLTKTRRSLSSQQFHNLSRIWKLARYSSGKSYWGKVKSAKKYDLNVQLCCYLVLNKQNPAVNLYLVVRRKLRKGKIRNINIKTSFTNWKKIYNKILTKRQTCHFFPSIPVNIFKARSALSKKKHHSFKNNNQEQVKSASRSTAK